MSAVLMVRVISLCAFIALWVAFFVLKPEYVTTSEKFTLWITDKNTNKKLFNKKGIVIWGCLVGAIFLLSWVVEWLITM